MELDDECEFDSTWEDEYEYKTPIKKICRRSRRNMYAAKDMQDFRHRVRNLDNDDDDDEPGQSRFYNLEFYQGLIKSSPDDFHIDKFHKQWKGRYDKLENCHSYIQWLFPIQERGMNWRAHVLTKKEIKLFRKDEEAKRKLVESYKLMLDFYGIRLVDETTGAVKRADNWKERFKDLNRYSHNNLRITRILKCLGTLGLKHYQAPLEFKPRQFHNQKLYNVVASLILTVSDNMLTFPRWRDLDDNDDEPGELFHKDQQAMCKLVESYKLILDFYRIHSVDESTGDVERAPNWKDRFRNLNRYSHNNLRITRILKCLGTLGLKPGLTGQVLPP